jgi:PAS domain S-box-containing protein
MMTDVGKLATPTTPTSVMSSLSPESFAEPEMLTKATPPFNIIHVNAAWTNLCGYSNAEVIGKPPTILQGENTNTCAAWAFARRLQSHGQATVTLSNRTKAGRDFRHRLEGSSVKNQLGETVRYRVRSTVVEPPRRRFAPLLVLLFILHVFGAPALALYYHSQAALTPHSGAAALSAETIPRYIRPVLMQVRLGHAPVWAHPKQPPTDELSGAARPPKRTLGEHASAWRQRAMRTLRSALPFGSFFGVAALANLDLLLISFAPAIVSGL